MSGPVCVKDTVSEAGPGPKLVRVPLGVKLPKALKFTTAFGAGIVIRSWIVPMKLPKLLVKSTDAPFVAVKVAKFTGVNAVTDDISPVELVTNPPTFERTEPDPIPKVDDVTPTRAAENVPSIVAACAEAAKVAEIAIKNAFLIIAYTPNFTAEITA